MLYHARIQKFCQTKSNLTLTHIFLDELSEETLKADHRQLNSKIACGPIFTQYGMLAW